jgi:hypothetical protein
VLWRSDCLPQEDRAGGWGWPPGWVRVGSSGSVLCRGRSWAGGAAAAFAGGGGAGWLCAHVVTDAGHDVAEVMQVLAGQGVEQQAAGDLDVAGHDLAEEGQCAVGDGDQGGAVVDSKVGGCGDDN